MKLVTRSHFGINAEVGAPVRNRCTDPNKFEKVGATAAISLEAEEITLVQRPMSHTPTTARYYQAVTGILYKHKKYKVFSDVTVTMIEYLYLTNICTELEKYYNTTCLDQDYN